MPALLGLRQGERLGLSMDSLDITGRRPRLLIKQQLAFIKGRGHYLKNATKNGDVRVIPINGAFLEAIKARVALRKEWSKRDDWNPDPQFANLLFLQPGGKLLSKNPDNKAWHSLGLNVRGHLNRHITGYLFGRLGVSMEIAGQILGHKSESFIRYYRVAADEVTGRELERHYDPQVFLDELDESFEDESPRT
jgi:integrase